MKATKILNEEISDLLVSSLPARPTAPKAFGGVGYTAKEMRHAFDKLSLFIIERYNALLEDVQSGALADAMPGSADGISLGDMISGAENGTLASKIKIDGQSIAAALAEIEVRLKALEESK